MRHLIVLFSIAVVAFGKRTLNFRPKFTGGPKFHTNRFFTNGKIMGGSDTTIEEHPWQCSLQYSGTHACGCSLIAWDCCLTAAHCTNGLDVSILSVRCGTTTMEAGGIVFNVRSYQQHPNFNTNTLENDMSVLYLQTAVTPSPQTGLIGLATAGATYPPGYPLTCTGWGSTLVGSSSVILQVVTINFIDNPTCDSMYGGGLIFANMLCAAAPGKDSCQGDNGGPLSDGTILVGTVSWGYSCANPNYPSVYASVPEMRSWIDSSLAP